MVVLVGFNVKCRRNLLRRRQGREVRLPAQERHLYGHDVHARRIESRYGPHGS